jgi:2-isopropylmalate synthase
VRLRGPAGAERIQASIGTGPVDAAFRAIDEIVDAPNTLVEYSVHSVTEGIDALGEVTVRIKSEAEPGRMFGGYGADTDVISASAQAYLAAINRLLEAQGRGSRGREIGPATVRASGASASVSAKAVGEAS